MTSRKDWLKERKTLLGASDVAAVLGVDPRRGPLAVYADKVGEAESVEETDWMRFGRHVEGAIALGYAEKTQREVGDLGAHTIQRHPDIPWLGATLDRITSGSDEYPAPAPLVDGAAAPLECKAVGFQKRADWEHDPPDHFLVQLQVQMACTRAQWGSLCALIGGLTIAWKDVLRHDAFLEAAFPLLEAFWLRVQRREPPSADALPGTTEAIKRVWARDAGETKALDDDETLLLVEEWERAKARRSNADTDVDRLTNELRARMVLSAEGEHPERTAVFGALRDGSFLTLKRTHKVGHWVKDSEYRTLRRWRPKGPRGRA